MAEHRKTAKLKGSDIDSEKNRRERLNVGPDHKTPLMQKKRRGSFP